MAVQDNRLDMLNWTESRLGPQQQVLAFNALFLHCVLVIWMMIVWQQGKKIVSVQYRQKASLEPRGCVMDS